jgi:UDP-3-O-acyl-N-acetylglucosamine deacetylase
MIPSHTIAERVGPLSGPGLFCGKPATLTIAPGASRGHVNFRSDGAYPRPFASARVRNLTYDTSWAMLPVPIRNTTLNASKPYGPEDEMVEPPTFVMATVEHLLAALAGLGVWEACITVEGRELPILDGSAKPFTDLLRPVLRDAPLSIEPLVLDKTVEVREGDASIIATPSAAPDEFSYTYRLDYGPASPLKPQTAMWRGGVAEFTNLIAPARTFSLKHEAEAARKLGLFPHLTPRDMLVIGDDGEPIDNEWRMENEPARHKLLDLIGDLSLLRRPLIADVVATRSGHRLTHEFCRACAAALAGGA